MISADRFLVRSTDLEEWKRVRETGVTATAVSRAATPSGFEEVIRDRENPVEIIDNAYMKFGRDSEGWIVAALKNEFGIFPNDWVICAEGPGNRWQMATPDGLSLDHQRIAEVKTTGKDWGQWKSVPIHYRRQVQWQLHVTGATECVFAWVLREETPDGFVAAWFEPKTVLVERDENMIRDLIEVAERLQLDSVYTSWQQEGN